MAKQHDKIEFQKEELTKEQKFDRIKKLIEENDAEESNLKEYKEQMKFHEKEYHKYAALLKNLQAKVIDNLKKTRELTK